MKAILVLLATGLFSFLSAEYETVNCHETHQLSNERKSFSYVDSVVCDNDVSGLFDSLFELKSDERFVKKFSTKPPVFYGAAFKTIPYSKEKVVAQIENLKTYSTMFKYVKDFQIIATSDDNPLCQTAYAQIGAAFLFKSWFILNLDSVAVDSLQRWGMYFSKNHLPTLNGIWEQKKKPFFTYLAREITIRFFVKEVDNNTTRVGYLLAVDAKSSVPGWLFGFVGKRVFPRFMKDLEKELSAPKGKRQS